jgi:hypothetical protein
MKNLVTLLIISGCFVVFSCGEKESERFGLLTDPTWVTDSLLANGVNAAGAGGLLTKFVGDAKFEKDGTGTFGTYKGEWDFNVDETKLLISSDSLPLGLTINSDIIELTSVSLKLKTLFPDPKDPLNPAALIKIRMTFKAK